MKAYISFILVFASLLILLYSFEASTNSNSIDLSRSLAVNRIFATELNIKENVIEAARTGAIEGFLAYSALAIPTDTFNMEDAKKAAKAGAYAKIASLNLHSFSNDMDIKLWCGMPSESGMRDLRDRMLLAKQAQVCDSCTYVTVPLCVDFISVNIVEVEKDDGTKTFDLASIKLTDENNEGFFGVSIYSKQYGISSVSYIPASLEIKP